jgi:uncharacterized OsmC-like protein
MSTSAATQLNEVDLSAVGALATSVIHDEHCAATTWRAAVRWTGGFRSEADIRSFDAIASDEPPALGGTDLAPNPVEQVLAALGNCLAVGYAANASARGIELRDLRIDVEGDLDLHAFLGLRDGHAGFGDVRVTVHLDTDASDDAVASLHEKVTATSPVGHTLAHAVPVAIELA